VETGETKMNAYKLADELKDLHGLYCEDAANMLRKQADRIAELEKELESAEVDIDVYRSEIAKLEKQLDNCTPTVDDNSQDWKGMDGATAFWLIERHSNNWTDAKKMMNEWFEANSTPQIKELSDEEIDEIMKQTSNWYEFARAILKKASEK
jgi:hypothetical protein